MRYSISSDFLFTLVHDVLIEVPEEGRERLANGHLAVSGWGRVDIGKILLRESKTTHDLRFDTRMGLNGRHDGCGGSLPLLRFAWLFVSLVFVLVVMVVRHVVVRDV